VHDTAADQWLDHVVLERLIDDEDAERDQPGRRPLTETERDQREGSDEPTDLGDEVPCCGPQTEDRRKGDAECDREQHHHGPVQRGDERGRRHDVREGCVRGTPEADGPWPVRG
jgi:hypothetical protein